MITSRRSFITGLITLVAGLSGKREPLVTYVAPQSEVDTRRTFYLSNRTEWVMLQQKKPYLALADSFDGVGYFRITSEIK